MLSNCLKRNSGNTGHESTSGADCLFCLSFEIVDFCPLQQNAAFMRADNIVMLHKKTIQGHCCSRCILKDQVKLNVIILSL